MSAISNVFPCNAGIYNGFQKRNKNIRMQLLHFTCIWILLIWPTKVYIHINLGTYWCMRMNLLAVWQKKNVNTSFVDQCLKPISTDRAQCNIQKCHGNKISQSWRSNDIGKKSWPNFKVFLHRNFCILSRNSIQIMFITYN